LLIGISHLPTNQETRQADPAGLLRRGVSLLFASGLADGVFGFADAAPNVTLSPLCLAFTFKMPVAERLPGCLFNCAGTFLDAAFDPLPVHWLSFVNHILATEGC
jgi:hypothetical protein